MPEISIIIPVYNVEQYLAKCLDSVLAQTFVDFEAICVNDGSPDNSSEILEDYAKKDSRIKIINQENKGLSGARNTGIRNSQGEYIFFLDSDDYIHPQALEVLYQAMQANGLEVVSGDFQDVFPNEYVEFQKISSKPVRIIKDSFAFACKAKDLSFTAWGKLYKKSIFENLMFDENCFFSEDVLFNTQVFSKIQKFGILSQKIYFYVNNPNSLIHAEVSPRKILSLLYVAEILHQKFAGDARALRGLERSRINQSLKNALKHLENCSKKEEIYQKIKELYARNIISYKGLSFKRRLQLWKIVH